MKGFDFEHPFFDPLWIRIAVFGVCMGWGLFELLAGAPFWAILFWGSVRGPGTAFSSNACIAARGLND